MESPFLPPLPHLHPRLPSLILYSSLSSRSVLTSAVSATCCGCCRVLFVHGGRFSSSQGLSLFSEGGILSVKYVSQWYHYRWLDNALVFLLPQEPLRRSCSCEHHPERLLELGTTVVAC